jgi:hypothetical protein
LLAEDAAQPGRAAREDHDDELLRREQDRQNELAEEAGLGREHQAAAAQDQARQPVLVRDGLDGAQAVAVQDGALEQIGHGGEADERFQLGQSARQLP